MNLCIVSFQTVLLAVLLVQYHYINEVEADKNPRYPNGNWFNSVEKKRIEIVQNDEEPEAQVIMEQEEAPKRRKKIIKKHKKRIRTKHEQREHGQHEHREHEPHVPHEQRLDASVEQDKEEYGKRVLRKDHKKQDKQERFNLRKFVKTSEKESNSSESDEVKKRKPVDIIVHIKMND